MNDRRTSKIDRLIQKELSEILRRETAKMRNIIVSVTEVRVAKDLSVAKVFLSVFPSARAKEIVDNVNNSRDQIRFELGRVTRSQLRVIPELRFLEDESLERLEQIDKLLSEHKPAPEDSALQE